MSSTAEAEYTKRLVNLQSIWWKRIFDVQAPYRWNIRRLNLGKTLDLGCGIGRNLKHLHLDSVGIDHNPHSIEICTQLGLKAYLPSDFEKSELARGESFDAILIAHVLEHTLFNDALSLIRDYLKFLRPNGRVVLITPQELGYSSDETHLTFFDFGLLTKIANDLNLKVETKRSFPFPRAAGKFFKYNEFNLIARK